MLRPFARVRSARGARGEIRKHPVRAAIFTLWTAGSVASFALSGFHPIAAIVGAVSLLTAWVYIWATR